VTGGAGGIGSAIAEALRPSYDVVTADLAGADVVLDVTDPASVNGVLADVGPIDVLVNAAGWDELKPFLETDEDFWERVIAINYKGCLRTTKALLPGMVERGWGRIVNIASDAGRVGSSGESVYAGTKAAVIAFGKTIAREVATKGVTVNAVCPGFTDTPIITRSIEAIVAKTGRTEEEALREFTKANPQGRLVSPQEVAGTVLWLASPGAGAINGQAIAVAGGEVMAG
jgi:2-hydroxycyclohexanecarboxyl-CoA dehydrogenase